MTKSIFVSPNGGDGWKVKQPSNSRASGIYTTQAQAIKEAREIAQNNKLELIVQGRSGQIRQKDSFGNDPEHING